MSPNVASLPMDAFKGWRANPLTGDNPASGSRGSCGDAQASDTRQKLTIHFSVDRFLSVSI
jgi:hypothetical protein